MYIRVSTHIAIVSQLIDLIINSRYGVLHIDSEHETSQNTDCKFHGCGNWASLNSYKITWVILGNLHLIITVYHYDNVSSIFKPLNTGKTIHEVNI